MTTEQATQIIAEELQYGDVLEKSLKDLKGSAGCYLSEEAWYQWTEQGEKEKFMPKAERYRRYLAAIVPQARAWNWTAVANCIEGCYRLLGAPVPDLDHGYEFHGGRHPVQVAMRETNQSTE